MKNVVSMTMLCSLGIVFHVSMINGMEDESEKSSSIRQDADAMVEVARYHAKNKSEVIAVAWFTKAALLGNEQALECMRTILESRDLIPRARLSSVIEENGPKLNDCDGKQAKIMRTLLRYCLLGGRMSYEPFDASQTRVKEKVDRWYENAARKGDLDAMYWLGIFGDNDWLIQAAQGGHKDAVKVLIERYNERSDRQIKKFLVSSGILPK